MRIPPRLLRALLVRGTLAWLLARVLAIGILSLQSAATGATDEAVSVGGTIVTSIWVIAFSAALLLVDFRRRKEVLLLRNLGLAVGHAILVGLSLGLVGETALLVFT